MINKVIEVLKYFIFIVDELLFKLNNVKIFFCVDVYKGFINIELDDVFLFLMIMYILIGCYCWLCMLFGVSLGLEEY